MYLLPYASTQSISVNLDLFGGSKQQDVKAAATFMPSLWGLIPEFCTISNMLFIKYYHNSPWRKPWINAEPGKDDRHRGRYGHRLNGVNWAVRESYMTHSSNSIGLG